MQLRRLEVVNIRSFAEGALDLGAGTTLLVGDVGAGKSSLLYAVEMALFGVAEVDAAYLVRHGTQHAEVAVRLEDGSHRYEIRRRFRKVRRRGRETYEPERLTYAEDDRPTAYSATEIRQRVIELLGFPDNPNPHAHSDLWRWAIYVPQERMREILAARPEERLETVRKALGVERYRTAADNATALATDLKVSGRRRREEAGRMAHWDVEFADATREADRLRAERVALESGARTAETTLASARAARRLAEEAVASLDADRRERDRLRREEADDAQAVTNLGRRRETVAHEKDAAQTEGDPLRVELADRSRRRDALASAEADLRRHRGLLEAHAGTLRELALATAAVEEGRRRSSEAGRRADRARSERDAAVRASATLDEEPPVVGPTPPTDRSVPDLEQRLAEAVAAEHAAVEAAGSAREGLDRISRLLSAGVCPTCRQPVRPEEFEGHRDEARRALAAATETRSERAAARQAAEEGLRGRQVYERDRERWGELERRRADARRTVLLREEELRSSEADRTVAEAEAAQAAARRDRLQPAEAENARLREAVAVAERALQGAQEAERRSATAEDRLRAATTIVQRATAELARIDGDLATIRVRQQARADLLRAVGLRLTRADTLAEELARVRNDETAREREASAAREALVRTDTRLDGLVERAATAERGRSERTTLLAEADDFDAKAAWVADPLRSAFLRMERELLAHAQAAFDRAFARFFASLIDDPTLVARTDVTFTPEVTIAGQATPAEALSGGERTSLALAFRLALASVVRQLGSVRLESLLLDEPTDGFSREQVVRMGELLDELALPQVVLVSHENELAGVADRTVRVVKVEGRSTLETEGTLGRAPAPGEAASEAVPASRRRERSERPRTR